MEITSSEGSNLSMIKWKENRTSFHFFVAKKPWGGGIMIYRVEGVGEWKRKNKESS